MKLVQNGVLILCALLSTSCIPYKDDYHYISLLNVNNIEVEKIQRPDNDNIHVKQAIPVEYLLPRDMYKIRFKIDEQGYLPNIIVSAFSPKTGEKIEVKPIKFRKSKRTIGNKCNSSYIQNDDTSFKFVLINCVETTSENPIFISFDVIYRNEVVGSEDIHFVLKKSGYYRVLDGI